MKRITGLLLVLGAMACFADTSVGVWWWNGRMIGDAAKCEERFAFLKKNSVTEIYCCFELAEPHANIGKFVLAAAKHGMRVSWLAGDVSWIRPGNSGFEKTLAAFDAYQKQAPGKAKLHALHLDVEPHQDSKLSDKSKWQLYADLVVRAHAQMKKDGYALEWDIPFWLDGLKVEYGGAAEVPLHEVVMKNADGVVLMSYRDTAKAMFDTAKEEFAAAAKCPCRVVLGAETGKTGEGDFVSFFEEGKTVMAGELGKVRAALEKAKLPKGGGVAVHHVGSWMQLKD